MVTSRLGNGRAGINRVLQMDSSSAMLQKAQARLQVGDVQYMRHDIIIGMTWYVCYKLDIGMHPNGL